MNVFNVKCFGQLGSGYFHFAPVTIIIGKNNVGKSTVIDVIEVCVGTTSNFVPDRQIRRPNSPRIEIAKVLDEDEIAKIFPDGVSGGGIPGQTHFAYGKRFIGTLQKWSLESKRQIKYLSGPDVDGLQPQTASAVRRYFEEKFSYGPPGCRIVRIAAERNVNPESAGATLAVNPDGAGLTNIVRAFINKENLPRELVEESLLSDLNEIYKGDSNFTAITCQESDAGPWEIYLREAEKGDIRLAESGSSLKSIFIVLAFLRLTPHLDQSNNWSKTIFCLEEPENNLHPALLRRLLDFLALKRQMAGFSIVMTTHSPICIDWASSKADCALLHVLREDGENTICRNVLNYESRIGILTDLDVRGSDILQANGIVWVEGPSDRIYLRKWIDLYTDGSIKEGSHYTVMYYGGKILSHFEAIEPDERSKLISMVTINRNVAVLMDSDRQRSNSSKISPRRRLNDTKQRIVNEVERMHGFTWVTAGREIENYVDNTIWQKVAKVALDIPDEYEQVWQFPPIARLKKTKVELAHLAAELLTKTDVVSRLDLAKQLDLLCQHIRKWNAI